MGIIKTVNLNNIATKYEERVEKIIAYPLTKKVEIHVFRQYYSSSGKKVKSESGIRIVTVNNQDLDGLDDYASQLVKDKEGL